MASIEGVEIADADAWWLIEQLRAIGRAEDAVAAFAIEAAIHRNDDLDDLGNGEKDAVLAALVDAPRGLVALRRTLAHDRRSRHGGE